MIPLNSLTLNVDVEQWPLTVPFRITGHTWNALDVVVVSLGSEGHVGRGEAAGVFYKGDTPEVARHTIELLRPKIEAGISRIELQALLPPGGARNALDCALWDLEAKLCGEPAWKMAGLEAPRPLLTTFTCGADDPKVMAVTALSYTEARAIKLKLTGQPIDADRVRAVRQARPDVWLGVDANQGFTREFLNWLVPVLLESDVQLIEQPFPRDQDALLDGLQCPIRIAADESVQSLAELPALADKVDLINIKLDKCGGLTEALLLARRAHELGLDTMVGSMLGTSLSMAPAYLVGQLCQVVDLDGPVPLQSDRIERVRYHDGFIECPTWVWGA